MRIITLLLAAGLAGAPALAQDPSGSAPKETRTAQGVSATPAGGLKMPDKVISEARRENLAMPPPPRGRYSFAPVDEGFLRFDHQSGEVALCRAQSGGWTCGPVAGGDAMPKPEIGAVRDEIAALKQEVAQTRALQRQIDDLRGQLDALKKEVAGLRPPPAPPSATPDKTNGVTITVPSKEDLARARSFIEDTWKHLIDMIATLQRDMLRKNGDAASGLSRT
ncbi:MAG TPA: hypothetical protein VFA57_20000 [Pseudolabrys sp.]|jgi:hypothetical protein|nr:hypothetical protein [Pseudolabrys sp.]